MEMNRPVVIVTRNYPPVVCGVGDYSKIFALHLANAGYNVHIICQEQEGVQAASGNPVVMPVIKEMTALGFAPALRAISDIAPVWLLIEYVPYSFHSKGIPLWLPGMLNKIDRQTKILLHVHEPFIRLRVFPLKQLIIGLLQRLAFWRMSKSAQAIVTSIDLYQQFLKKFSNKRIDVIPIPSNILPIEVSESEREQLRREVGVLNGPIISTFGIRDHAFLVEVFQLVKIELPDVKLLVVGAIPDRKVYDPVAESVFITGYQSPDMVFRYLKASDIFFLPDFVNKRMEGGTSNKGASVATALSADLTVVGLRGDMNNSLLKQSRAIHLEDKSQPEQVAKKLIELLRNKLRTNESRNFWEQNLAWPVIMDRYRAIIEHHELLQ